MNIKRLLGPSLICLVLGGALAGAQSITKALQLSQDNTGAFGVDVNNGVYFPGHVLSPTTTNRPLPTITGTGVPTDVGTDTSGLITMGTSATTATVVFGTAYVTVPQCVITSQTATTIGYTLATTSIAITQNTASGNKINYFCPSAS